MPDLRSLRTVCRDGTSRTTAVLRVHPGLQLEVSGQPDLQQLGVGLIGQQWSARLASPSKDVLLKLERRLKGSKLTVEQFVPAGKAYLIPCPAFKLDRRAVLRTFGDGGASLSSRMQAQHNCLARRSSFTQTLYSGPDRQHKLKVGLSTEMGPSLLARTKLRRGWAHSAALAVAPATGPELQLKSRPAAGQKYSLTVQPQQHSALVCVQLRPTGGNTKLRASAACSLRDSAPQPRLALDLTWSV